MFKSNTITLRTRGGRLAVALVTGLLVALVFQLTLSSKPAEATAPGVKADDPFVTVNEGQTATNTGTYGDLDPGDTVTISASLGIVSQTPIDPNTDNGTWSWSYTPTDGPAQSGRVTITAKDSTGQRASTNFSLTVNNLPPTATLTAPSSVTDSSLFTISLDNPQDRSSSDTAAGFSFAFDCGSGSGYGAFSSANTTSCTARHGPKQTVKGKVRDKDGGETEYLRSVAVNPALPPGGGNPPGGGGGNPPSASPQPPPLVQACASAKHKGGKHKSCGAKKKHHRHHH